METEIVEPQRALPPPRNPWQDVIDALNNALPPETIDGVSVSEVAKHDVMLDVAFSPVLQYRISPDPADQPWLENLPKPVAVDVDALGRGYCIINPPEDTGWGRRPMMTTGSWEFVKEAELKVMRARFLLLRDWLYKRLHVMPYRERQAAVAWYFQGGVWTPKPGSDMARKWGFLEPR